MIFTFSPFPTGSSFPIMWVTRVGHTPGLLNQIPWRKSLRYLIFIKPYVILLITQDWETTAFRHTHPTYHFRKPTCMRLLEHTTPCHVFIVLFACTLPPSLQGPLKGQSFPSSSGVTLLCSSAFLAHPVPTPIPPFTTLLFSYLASSLEFEFLDSNHNVLFFTFYPQVSAQCLAWQIVVECVTKRWKWRSPLLGEQGCRKPRQN